MSEPPFEAREFRRITCCVHHGIAPLVEKAIADAGVLDVFEQVGRSVRQYIRRPSWIRHGMAFEVNDAPARMFRLTADANDAAVLFHRIVDAAGLDSPGRGSVYVQRALDYRVREQPGPLFPGQGATAPPAGALKDLTLITAIVSAKSAGNRLARSVLELGAGVPIMTRGFGTGIRNKMGLLRITIPPEKDIMHIVVPAHDANSIMRLLIEDAALDRPGGGFLYQTPVLSGVIDPMMRLGYQEHPASMEQIIAAVDELKAGTAWRKRFTALDDSGAGSRGFNMRGLAEISFVCAEGHADRLIKAALDAGAGAATVSLARQVAGMETDQTAAAREYAVLCVPSSVKDAVVKAIIGAATAPDSDELSVQTLDCPAAFAHQTAGWPVGRDKTRPPARR